MWQHLTAEDFTDARPRGIIGMVNGEITTVDAGYSDRIDVEYDVLKIAVVERHKNTHHIGIGFLQGYGLKSGAVATSVSHDSHNIIVVGTSEDDMRRRSQPGGGAERRHRSLGPGQAGGRGPSGHRRHHER